MYSDRKCISCQKTAVPIISDLSKCGGDRGNGLRCARLCRPSASIRVLPRLCGRIARPCDRSTYTSTSSGCSPAQSASPKHRSARLTAAISAALVTLWEFVASHKPRFGHAKPYLHSFVHIVPHKRLRACRSWPVSLTFVSFVPSPVRDAIRVAILRRALFSLRSNFRPPCLACASRPVRRMAL